MPPSPSSHSCSLIAPEDAPPLLLLLLLPAIAWAAMSGCLRLAALATPWWRVFAAAGAVEPGDIGCQAVVPFRHKVAEQGSSWGSPLAWDNVLMVALISKEPQSHLALQLSLRVRAVRHFAKSCVCLASCRGSRPAD